MSQVVTYQNDESHCFCQLHLESGGRIFVSIGSGRLRISKMLLGIVPTKTLLDLGTSEADRITLAALFVPDDADMDAFAKVSLLDHVVAALRPCRSMAEVQRRLDPDLQVAIRVQQITEAALHESVAEKARLQTLQKVKTCIETMISSSEGDWPEKEADQAWLRQVGARCQAVLTGAETISDDLWEAVEGIQARLQQLVNERGARSVPARLSQYDMEVISRFGAFLEESASRHTALAEKMKELDPIEAISSGILWELTPHLRPESELPAPAAEIRASLERALALTDDPKFHEQLRVGLVSLREYALAAEVPTDRDENRREWQRRQAAPLPPPFGIKN